MGGPLTEFRGEAWACREFRRGVHIAPRRRRACLSGLVLSLGRRGAGRDALSRAPLGSVARTRDRVDRAVLNRGPGRSRVISVLGRLRAGLSGVRF